MKRTFIGLKIDINPTLAKVLSDLKRKLDSENIRWTDSNNLHLTLRFLGDTEDSQLINIYRKLEILCRRYDQFFLEINGIGLFGKSSAPKILWAGVKMPEKAYLFVAEIEEIACMEGFEPETRPYSPHLTLCRIKSLQNPFRLNDLVGQNREVHFLTQEVNEIIVYESVLKSSGAVYLPLKIFKLNDERKVKSEQ